MPQLRMMSIMDTFCQKVSFNRTLDDTSADELCRYSGGAEHLVIITFPSIRNINNISRAMTRDEEVYQDADSFQPERFLKADGTLNDDTMDYAFGFGRRYVRFTPVLDKTPICFCAEFVLGEPSLRQRYDLILCSA